MIPQGRLTRQHSGQALFCCLAPTYERGDMLRLGWELCKVAAGELWAVLVDARECGDLRGHLAAWWGLMVGRVDPEDTYRAVRRLTNER